MFILKILFIFFICLNISSSYASNIKNSAVVFMYHKFGVSKYPSTSVTLDQFDAHLTEFSKLKYSETIIKWDEELIGKNSVIPWIKDRMNISIMLLTLIFMLVHLMSSKCISGMQKLITFYKEFLYNR